jgi:ubiquinone/menaquinone biosynthesis C-methylase UbiE
MNVDERTRSTSPGSAPYFNTVADTYAAWYQAETPAGYALRVRKQRVLELLNGVGGRVLDVGSGPGIMVPDLVERGCEVWAVDAAPEMIRQCRVRFGHWPQVHCAVGSATALSFPQGTFDAVLCMGVIDRIREYDLAITELLRVLKPGGLLLLAFPNVLSPWASWRGLVVYRVLDWLRPLYYRLLRRPRPPAVGGFLKLYTARAAVRIIRRHAGECCGVTYYNFNVCLSPLDALLPRSTVWLSNKLETYRSQRMLRCLGTGFIVQAVKRGEERGTWG